MKKLILSAILSMSFIFGAGIAPTYIYVLPTATSNYSGATIKQDGVSGVITANYFEGSGSRLTGLSVFLTTSNADARYAPITISFLTTANADIRYMAMSATIGILTANADTRYAPITISFLTTANADIRYDLAGATANRSITANFATTANFAVSADTLDNQHGSYYQPASTAVTTNYSGNVTVNTIYATTYVNYPASGGGSGITTVNADARYVSWNGTVGNVSINGTISANFFVGNGAGLTGVVGGNGISTANADAKYVSINYSGAVTLNGTTYLADYKEKYSDLGSMTGAVTITLNNGSIQTVTASASTLTLSLPAAQAGRSITIILNPSTYTIAWGTVFWLGTAGSTTAPSITASKKHVFNFFSDGTNWYGSLNGVQG